MKKLTTILFATALATITPQCVRAQSVDKHDADFIRKAAEGNLEEIQTAHIALQRSQDPQVRAYAEKIANDHAKANADLQKIAAAKGVEMPTSLTPHKDHMNQRLLEKSPGKIDRELVDHWVKDHKEDIKQYDSEAKKAKDPQVNQYAASQLPILQEHLSGAQALNKKS
jgi:putative membrane protein